MAVAAFWIWFGIASGAYEELDILGVFLHTLMPGGILLLTVLIAWRWEAVGGGLLALEGLVGLAFIFWAFSAPPWHPTTLFFMIGTLAGPPLLAGALFLADWWTLRHPPSPRPTGA